MKQDITDALTIPEGVTASYTGGVLSIKGKLGEVQRTLRHPNVQIAVANKEITFTAKNATQREKRHFFTLRAHARNILKGVSEGHTYKLKICSGHFPMNVSISGQKFVIKNFLGEAVPRELTLKQGAQVKIDGDIVTVTSPNKEIAGSQASDIEQLTRISNRDRRIFQDGLYIIEKDGKEIA